MTWAGLTRSTARSPRPKSVPRMDSALRSRSSWAVSSSSVASGTGGVPSREHVDRGVAGAGAFGEHLLGAHRVIALPPSVALGAVDLLAQAQDAGERGLGPRRAPGHMHVDRQELVRRHERVVVEDAHRGAAGAHRDGPAGLEHLVVDAADDRGHLHRHAAGEDEQVRLARRGPEGLPAEPRDIDAGTDDGHHLHRAARQPEGQRPDRVALRPRHRLLDGGGEHAVLDVALQRLALQVAAQHVAGLQLTRAEVRRRSHATEWFALYFHSKAPRRQTYTNATIRSTTNVTVSHSAKVPNARSWTAIGYRKMTSMSNRMNSIAIR